jgi:hypothetical protein
MPWELPWYQPWGDQQALKDLLAPADGGEPGVDLEEDGGSGAEEEYGWTPS